jgi:hypothetical protein
LPPAGPSPGDGVAPPEIPCATRAAGDPDSELRLYDVPLALEGACRWTDRVADPTGLALGMIENTAVACLIHPEHGGTGIAPGRYLVRRRRERAASRQGLRGGDQLIADRRHRASDDHPHCINVHCCV